jgi:hypothetical protein
MSHPASMKDTWAAALFVTGFSLIHAGANARDFRAADTQAENCR